MEGAKWDSQVNQYPEQLAAARVAVHVGTYGSPERSGECLWHEYGGPVRAAAYGRRKSAITARSICGAFSKGNREV